MKANVPAKRDDEQLKTLAAQIQDDWHHCDQLVQTAAEHAQTALEHAQAIGAKLIEAKGIAGHGKWKSWVAANLPFSIDKAERMMRLHKNWDRLKTAPVPIMGIKEAIGFLFNRLTGKQDIIINFGEAV